MFNLHPISSGDFHVKVLEFSRAHIRIYLNLSIWKIAEGRHCTGHGDFGSCCVVRHTDAHDVRGNAIELFYRTWMRHPLGWIAKAEVVLRVGEQLRCGAGRSAVASTTDEC